MARMARVGIEGESAFYYLYGRIHLRSPVNGNSHLVFQKK